MNTLAYYGCCLLALFALTACSPMGNESPPSHEEGTQTPPAELEATEEETAASVAAMPASSNDMAASPLQQRNAIPAKSFAFADEAQAPPPPTVNRENYATFEDQPVRRVREHPVSTFSIDVDTGAYSNTRRLLQNGQLPPQDAVRAEEFINYFSYEYPTPSSQTPPFRIITELGPTPWNAETQLLHIGLKGYEVPQSELAAANLVFLIDVSGSMNQPDKLGLLKSALTLLSNQLTAQDRVAIVVYAGAAGLVLPATPANETAKIKAALAQLSAGGSTNGGDGIQLAYQVARQHFIEGGINRILLATDGDFNVGTVNFESLKDLVERQRKNGVSLTTLGFGTGNYNDHLMEQLADAGNGNYAYIDTLSEAQKVLVTQLSSTFQTIAKDVKIQIEFNPAVVAEYRLIGYENRLLKREDFSNDKVDAGDIGAGHTVTALYEVALVGSQGQRLEALRYEDTEQAREVAATDSEELAFLRLRYKPPMGDSSQLIEQPLLKTAYVSDLTETSDVFRFSAAVAAFAQQLRGGHYLNQFDYPAITALANTAKGADQFGYRGEFIQLVNLAASLTP